MIINTVSGRHRRLPASLANIDPDRIVGLDAEGRIVVDWFDAFTADPSEVAGHVVQPHLFGLTLCCNASDKGIEDGVVCRGCYGYDETGNYLFRAPDGTFPGFDPRVDLSDVLSRERKPL